MYKTLRILVISNIYPGENDPTLGIFIKNNLDYLKDVHKFNFTYCLKKEIDLTHLGILFVI